jgi:glycosyltransferase involved in cell wall biosynthesis
VLPSLNEGMGRVLVEAAAAGTPVVASRVGGVPELVRDGVTGLLVEPRDPRAIAAAVSTLCANERQRESFGEAARKDIAPRFALESMVARIEAEYDRLLKEKRLDTSGGDVE